MAGDRVECRSDHDYTGRPLAFYWQDQRLEVTEVLVQYRTPSGITYQVHDCQPLAYLRLIMIATQTNGLFNHFNLRSKHE